jgi:DNA helicase-2/ATP-dependent DNA helicase PcrA
MTSKESILKGLNENQKKVAQHIRGNLMVCSIPGSGKTSTVVSRAAYMIEDGVEPSSILLFTFTKKAANEIKERLTNKIGDIARSVTVSTYHSFCSKLLRKYAEFAGLTRSYSIYDDEDKAVLLKRIVSRYYSELTEDEYGNDLTKQEIKDHTKKVGYYIAEQKKNYIFPDEAKSIAKNRQYKYKNEEDYANIYEEYETELKNNNAVDFDNLIIFMVKIMNQYPDIRKRITEQYRFLIADEVQDSSFVDVNFIFLLGEENGNMCLVGDPDQSIYRFRGANTNYLYKRIDQNKTFTFYELGQNYRSTKNIVNAYASVIKKNPRRSHDADMHTDNDTGEKIIIQKCANPKDEAYSIAKHIKNILKITQNNNIPYTYDDFAVLCRMTFQTRVIEQAFLENNIRYEIVSGVSFYSRKEIKDILGYLYFIENPLNTVALKRIINAPNRKIGEKSYEKLEALMLKKIGSYGIIDINKMIDILQECAKETKGVAAKGLKLFIDNISAIKSYIDIPDVKVDEIIRYVINTVDYNAYLSRTERIEEEYENRIMNLSELQEIASGYDTLAEFLSDTSLADKRDDEQGENEDSDIKGHVKIMTMHASKGLEFGTVFIAGANETIIPSSRSISDSDIQEERRLFYVAMSRAKELLFIFNNKSMLKNGYYMALEPSRFLSEINQEYTYQVKPSVNTANAV